MTLVEAQTAAATVVAAAALVLAVAVLVATGSPPAALPVLLDLLLAAGLLRLAPADTWTALGTAAAVVVIRKLVVGGLRGPSPPAARSRSGTRSGPATPEWSAADR